MPAGVFIARILTLASHSLETCMQQFTQLCAGTSRNDVDSMFSQHAKWLKVTLELPWRRKIASLNYLLASHVWKLSPV
jgi:hypothetical protein